MVYMKRNKLFLITISIWILFLQVLFTATSSDAFSTNNIGNGSSGSAKPKLVVGATGKVGRLVVKQLLEEKQAVSNFFSVQCIFM